MPTLRSALATILLVALAALPVRADEKPVATPAAGTAVEGAAQVDPKPAPAAKSAAPATQPAPQSAPAAATAAPPTTATPAATTPAAATPEAAAPAAPTAAPPVEAPPPLPPPPVLPPEINATITNVVGTMDDAEKKLTEISNVHTDLGHIRDDIDNVISKTTQTADGLRPRLSEIQGHIKHLGPPPAANAPPEAATVAAERARLSAEETQVSGAIKTLEVTWWRARQAIDKITDLRLSLFVKSLTERIASPLFPDLWSDVAHDWHSVSWRLTYNARDIWSSFNRQKVNVIALFAAAIGLYLFLKAIILALIRYRPNPDATPPTFFERARSAAWIAPARAVPGIATAFLLYGGLDYLGLLYYPTAAPAGAALIRAALVFIAVSALISAVFAPGRPERRLVLLSTRSARRISRLLKLLALVYSADLFLSSVAQILYFPLSLSVVQSLATTLAFVFVLIGLLLTPFQTESDDPNRVVGRNEPAWLKVPLWFAAISIIACCLLGYVALGRFLAQQMVMTGVVGLVATLAYLAIRAFTRGSTTERGHISMFLENEMGFDETRRKQLAWLIESVLTLAVAFIAIPVLLLQWGFSAPDIRDWAKRLLFGFEIGQIRISLVRILIGVALFIGLLFLTRLVQRRLRDNVLLQPRMDAGIANSIDTAVGYAGTALAAIIAISYAGFDITNLAIVAGALSVGIGFGLQSIVNNFVSGLILLIERPIKVGDWVVVGGEQGTVKRISVRSTEIETFDRASLIVPNSELVTGRVLNWTHRNALGRVVMKFSAAADADPKQVLAVLAECAGKHPNILREPAPLPVFEGYTATTTEYSLRVLLPDITHGLKVQSDLRIAIYEALRRAHVVGADAFAAPSPVPPEPPHAPATASRAT